MTVPTTVLFLGPPDSPLLEWLKQGDDPVIQMADPVTPAYIRAHEVGFAVSYGYRHILCAAVLDSLGGRAVNLHISLLPWNRGADPNLWSFVDDTPKGCTIHYIDEGIDTGDIIAQRQVVFDDTDNETLATTYARLHREIEALFRETWPGIRRGTCQRQPQSGTGTFHTSSERKKLAALLDDGWDTTVASLRAFRGLR